MKSQYFLYPVIALSAAAIRQSAVSLCPLQLYEISTTASLERTNDWTIVSQTSNTLWPAAKFYLALDGRLYGGNGQACSFSPNLRCAVSDPAAARGNFTVANDRLLSSDGGKDFWFCPDLDGDAHHAEAAPLIFPPTGFHLQGDEPEYEGCSLITLISDHCVSEAHFSLDPQKVNLGGGANAQETTTSSSERLTSTIKHSIVGVILAILLA